MDVDDGVIPGSVSVQEIILLLLVCLVLFGSKRLPEIGRSVGTGLREFKQHVTGRAEIGE